MMANLTTRIPANILNHINDIEDHVLTSYGLQSYADELVWMIVERVRSGYGCSEFAGHDEQLAWLEESTIRKRRWMADKGELHWDTSPETSNLTATGQMLDSIYADSKRGSIYIKFRARSDSRYTNMEIAKFVSDDRPFINPTAHELEVIGGMIQDEIVREFF